MTDYTELRDLCTKATQGPWTLSGYKDSPDGSVYVNAPKHGGFARVVWRMSDDRRGRSPMCEATAKFIAAANPSAISALLDELDAFRKEEARRASEATSTKLEFRVISYMSRDSIVALEVPKELLEDGAQPDLHSDLRDPYEEWVTDHVYAAAESQNKWDEHQDDSSWEAL